MVLKKRHSINVQDDGPKRRRKEEVREEPEEIKKKSKKGNEYPVKVEENRLSDDEYEEDDPEEDDDEVEEEDEDVNDDPEDNAALGKENINELGWPQADIIELFNKIEAVLPRNDIMNHSTRIERLNWEEIAFNNYSPSECKRVWSYVHKRIRHFRVLKEVLDDARVWIHKPWTDFYKGSKTAHHPDMPRRPPTKYLLYFAAKRDKVTAQNPNLDMPKISKIVSQMWNALPASKKNKYDQMANSLKAEYNEKLRLFYDAHPGFEEEAKMLKLASNNKKLSKALPPSSGLPNKPRTAKQLFIEDKLEKVKNEPNLDKREARAEASTQWDNLSDKRRLMWIERAVEEETKYLDKIKLFKADNPDFEVPKHKSVLTKDEVLLRNRASGKPSKPPNSAYSLYSKIMLAKCADLRSLVPKERMKEISLRWNKMSDSEKEEYQKKVKYEQERFKLDYATYLESLPEEVRQEELLKTQKSTNSRRKAPKARPEVNNGKKAKSKSTKTNKKQASPKKADRQYFPGEPHPPPVNAYDLFVDSFVSDTKLCATEAPRFWEMLPNSDKAKFTRKLTELKEKYIRDYKKFLKSLDEEQVAKYNELQKRNKEREVAAEAQKEQLSEADEDSDDESSSDEAANENEPVNNKDANDSDSDENNEAENKKSDSSSDSSSSSSGSSSDSSSSDDSDSSSDDSDDEDKTSTKVAVKKEESDSDSDDSD